MNAKQVPRIRLEGRTKLQDVIPLDTPIHMFIDPSAACNFSCKFCFNAHKEKTFHNIMKYDLFTKIIDDCMQFPRKMKALRLYAYGDPLLNPMLPQMVRYAKRAEVADIVEFTTNGWWLNPDKNRRLIDAGLDRITISVGGLTVQQFQDMCGRNVNPVQYRRNIRHFYNHKKQCTVHVKATNVIASGTNCELFFKQYGDICDEISIDNIVPIWPGTELSVVSDPKYNIYMREIKPVEVCTYIFYHLTVNANGDICPCFIDWEHKNILGNAKVDSVYEIWHSPKLTRMRIDHLQKNRKAYPLCAECGQLKYGEPDCIDEYRDEILGRLM